MNASELPRYDDLPGAGAGPPRSTWGLFGKDDEVGALNLIGPQQVADAARLVRQGRVFPLNWDVDQPSPAILGRRSPVHTVVEDPGGGRDDWYDSFYPQASSQWDALSHVRHPEHGFYNGIPLAETPGSGGHRLGIHAWARRGIAGRFLLLDLARHRERAGRPLDCGNREQVDTTELDQVMGSAGLSPRTGDILLLRFGWIHWYRSLERAGRQRLGGGGQFPAPGLAASESMARWLWDNGFAAVAADCPALEAMPFDQGTEDGFLHYRLVPLLGMAVGELFALDDLASHCAGTGVYEGLLVSAPIQKTGGVGSPANAVALL